MVVDRESNFLCVATSKGFISCWDLRYQIKLTDELEHEKNYFIRKLAKNPADHRYI